MRRGLTGARYSSLWIRRDAVAAAAESELPNTLRESSTKPARPPPALLAGTSTFSHTRTIDIHR